MPTRKETEDLGFSYNMVRKRYMDYRLEIFDYLSFEFRKLCGEIECDILTNRDEDKKKEPR